MPEVRPEPNMTALVLGGFASRCTAAFVVIGYRRPP